MPSKWTDRLPRLPASRPPVRTNPVTLVTVTAGDGAVWARVHRQRGPIRQYVPTAASVGRLNRLAREYHTRPIIGTRGITLAIYPSDLPF